MFRTIQFSQIKQYRIDNILINKQLLSNLLKQSLNNNKSFNEYELTLQNFFTLCHKLQQYEQNRSNRGLKDQILNLIQSKLSIKSLLLLQQDKYFEELKINLDKVYYLNKPGNFGRVLQRKCRIVPKGLMEYQDNKQAKLKFILSFINKIQYIQNKDNLTQLPWINIEDNNNKNNNNNNNKNNNNNNSNKNIPEYKINKLNLFRIILLDTNSNKKGIYFDTFEQAQKVRVYLCYQYKKNKINSQVIDLCKYKLVKSIGDDFVNKIKQYNQIKRFKKEMQNKQKQMLLNQDSNNNNNSNNNSNIYGKNNISNNSKFNINMIQKSGSNMSRELQDRNRVNNSKNTKNNISKQQQSQQQISYQTNNNIRQMNLNNTIPKQPSRSRFINTTNNMNNTNNKINNSYNNNNQYQQTINNVSNIKPKQQYSQSSRKMGYLDQILLSKQNKKNNFISNQNNQSSYLKNIDKQSKIRSKSKIILNDQYQQDYDTFNMVKNDKINLNYKNKDKQLINKNKQKQQQQNLFKLDDQIDFMNKHKKIIKLIDEKDQSNNINNNNSNINNKNINKNIINNNNNNNNSNRNNNNNDIKYQPIQSFGSSSPIQSPIKTDNGLSPNKNISRLSHSRKQQSIFPLTSKYNKNIVQEQQQQSTQRLQYKNMMDSSNNGINLNRKLGTERIKFKAIQFFDLMKLLGLQNNTNSNNSNNSNNNNNNNNANSNNNNIKLLFKPIISIQIYKASSKQHNLSISRQSLSPSSFIYQHIFNSIIKSRCPHRSYQLYSSLQSSFHHQQQQLQQIFSTSQNLSNFIILIKVINFIKNEEVLQTEIILKDNGFVINKDNTLVDKKEMLRLTLEYKNTGTITQQQLYSNNNNNINNNNNNNNINNINNINHNNINNNNNIASAPVSRKPFLQFPQINPEIISKIKNYWQTQAISSSYYNLQDNFNLFDAVSNSSTQAQPQSWWTQLDQIEYNYLCILQSSSVILGYKIVKPMLYLVKAIKNLSQNQGIKIEKIIQMLLSLIINFGKSYYFTKEIEKINCLHKQVGLTSGNNNINMNNNSNNMNDNNMSNNNKNDRIQFQNRILFQKLLFQKLFQLQCPQLFHIFQENNISFSLLILQYTYQMFSRVLQIQILFQFWNYCSIDMQKVPLLFFLASLAITNLLKDKLIKSYSFNHVKQVFQKKSYISSVYQIIKEIDILKKKYFVKKIKGFMEQLRSNQNDITPFEIVIKMYHKKIQEKQLERRQFKHKQKLQLCQKIIQGIGFDQATQGFNLYGLSKNNNNPNNKKQKSSKKFIIHIYFYNLPQMMGKLVLLSQGHQYQSLKLQKNKYFIIGQIGSQVILKFTDYKGDQFTGQLLFNQGFNQFKINIKCQKIHQSIQIHYLCGLLTDNQIELIKNNKKYQHFIGPNIEIKFFYEEFLKKIKQSKLLSNFNHEYINEKKWYKDIKILFGYGSKQFNQIQCFLYLLSVQKRTFEEKVYLLKQFSTKISRQQYLCDNKIIFKQLLRQYLKINNLSLSNGEYECYFKGSLQKQFDAPKIIKCRFFLVSAQNNNQTQNINIKVNQKQMRVQKQLRLQKQLNKFLSQKSSRYLYGDLTLQQIVSICSSIFNKYSIINKVQQGMIKLLYSNYGKVQLKVISVKIDSSNMINKKLLIDYDKQIMQSCQFVNDISHKEPEILLTEILPSFTKISTILDYVNGSRYNDLRGKIAQRNANGMGINNTQQISAININNINNNINSSSSNNINSNNNNIQKRLKKNQSFIPQCINLLSSIQHKLRSCVFLRYSQQQFLCDNISIPFFSYYSQLKQEFILPLRLKYYVINNARYTIKTLCLQKGNIGFNVNKQEQFQWDKYIGLYGNLRKVKHLFVKNKNTVTNTNAIILASRILNNQNNANNNNSGGSANKLNSVVFWTSHKDQSAAPYSLFCHDYGYGVYRWEKCIIRKYKKYYKEINKNNNNNNNNNKNINNNNNNNNKNNNKNNNINNNKQNKKVQIQYLIENINNHHNNNHHHEQDKYFATQYQVKIHPLARNMLEEYEDKQKPLFQNVQSDIKEGINFLLDLKNINSFLESKNKTNK